MGRRPGVLHPEARPTGGLDHGDRVSPPPSGASPLPCPARHAVIRAGDADGGGVQRQLVAQLLAGEVQLSGGAAQCITDAGLSPQRPIPAVGGAVGSGHSGRQLIYLPGQLHTTDAIAQPRSNDVQNMMPIPAVTVVNDLFWKKPLSNTAHRMDQTGLKTERPPVRCRIGYRCFP